MPDRDLKAEVSDLKFEISDSSRPGVLCYNQAAVSSRCAIHALVLLLSGLLSACNVALGPGYTVVKQQYDVTWTGTSELLIRATYRVKNTGKAPVEYIEATLPDEARRSGLQVWVNGASVAVGAADESTPAGTVRIPISPVLRLKGKQDLVIEYRLSGAADEGAATPSFYLETLGWYPVLRKQEGLFGSGGDPPDKWDLRVTVPRDFLVHAAGIPKGKKRRRDVVEHHFRQRPDRHTAPFVIAGRYTEQRARTTGSEVILWTFQPLPDAAASDIGNWIGRTALEYEKAFGRMGEDESAAVRVAELPPRFTSHDITFADGEKVTVGHMDFIEATFPGGVLLPTGRLARSADRPEGILRSLDEQLALSWFHHGVTAASDSRLLFYFGLPPYAASIAAETRGDAACRNALAASGLADYASLGGEASEPRFFLNDGAVSPERLAYARSKAPLFFLALEDHYGKDAARRALARLAASLRGRQFTTNDLRVAIQLETGQDPAEFFRQWLNVTGIPEEFRKKYENQVSGSR